MHDVVNGKSPVQYYLIRKITDIYSYKCYNTIAAARKSLYQPRTRLNNNNNNNNSLYSYSRTPVCEFTL